MHSQHSYCCRYLRTCMHRDDHKAAANMLSMINSCSVLLVAKLTVIL